MALLWGLVFPLGDPRRERLALALARLKCGVVPELNAEASTFDVSLKSPGWRARAAPRPRLEK